MSNSHNDYNVAGRVQNINKISFLTIVDIVILLFGILFSITSTVKTLKFTYKYIWCFAFAILGVIFVIFLIRNMRKKLVWLIGVAFICIYLVAAGFGAIVCEMNSARLGRISYYEGKSVEVQIDDAFYEWDGQSVTYDSRELTYISESSEGNHVIHILVDGEEKNNNVLVNQNNDNIYLEITGGGTGIYLILESK